MYLGLNPMVIGSPEKSRFSEEAYSVYHKSIIEELSNSQPGQMFQQNAREIGNILKSAKESLDPYHNLGPHGARLARIQHGEPHGPNPIHAGHSLIGPGPTTPPFREPRVRSTPISDSRTGPRTGGQASPRTGILKDRLPRQ